MRRIFAIITISAFLVMLSGAVSEHAYNRADTCLPDSNELNGKSLLNENDIIEIEPEMVPLAALSAQAFVPVPVASKTLVKNNDKAEIDYSNTKDGYIMVKYLDKTDKELRVIVKGPGGESYTYSLNSNGNYEVFPLSVGNGSYQVSVYENINGTKYNTVISVTFQVKLTDEYAPFLRPNQYINYNSNSETIKKATELLKGSNGIVTKISSVYKYVTENITYDKELAKNVQSGYLSNVDAVLRRGKGICFDYAAVMTAMLRSQQIPTKLVIGYSGSVYHAWINVYSEETGWIDNAIHFDGKSWTLMDPTFAAGKTAGTVKAENYTAKLIY